MGEGENVVEVDGMNVGDGVGVTARVSSTRSVGSTSECTHSIYIYRMMKTVAIVLLVIINCLLSASTHFEQMHIPCTTPASWLPQ